MYSTLMLPNDEIKRNKIYEIAQSRSAFFAFVMENLETQKTDDIEDELTNYELKSCSQSVELFLNSVGS